MTRDEFVKALTIAVDAGIAVAGHDEPLTETDLRAILGNLSPALSAQACNDVERLAVLATVAHEAQKEFAR